MQSPSFDDITDRLMRYLQDADYEAALGLVETYAPDFPEHEREFFLWRMAIFSAEQRLAEAIDSFRDALEAGHWYHPVELEEDELVGLHGLPAFDELAEMNAARFAQEQAAVRPLLNVTPPEGHPPPHPALVTLHGNKSNARLTSAHWRPATQQAGYLLATPQSGQLAGPDSYFWNDTRQSVQEMRTHITGLQEHFPVDWPRSLLAGFSGGAGLAIYLAFADALRVPLRGFIALAPYIPNIEEWDALVANGRERNLRGTIIVGAADRLCMQTVQGLQFFMRQHGLACQVDMIPGWGHHYPVDFDERLAAAIQFIEEG
jgi:predicted esterase